MVSEEKVVPTTQVDVEEKTKGVHVCPTVTMDAAQAGICCHLLWR